MIGMQWTPFTALAMAAIISNILWLYAWDLKRDNPTLSQNSGEIND